MNSNMKILLVVFAVMITASGCSSKAYPLAMMIKNSEGIPKDGFISMKTVSDTPMTEASFVQIGTKEMVDGKERLIEKAGKLSINPRLSGKLLQMAFGEVAQTAGDKEVAKIHANARKCNEKAELCNSTFIAGSQSMSIADSVASSETESSIAVTDESPNPFPLGDGQ